MSVIDDYLVLSHLNFGDTDLETFNQELLRLAGLRHQFASVDGYTPDGPRLQGRVWVGAMKFSGTYTGEETVCQAMRAVPWEYPHYVQLLIKREDDETWSFVDWQNTPIGNGAGD